jgi:lipopolysaccharide/colanic/teichoic acid biosynthesis glycosyltransferase
MKPEALQPREVRSVGRTSFRSEPSHKTNRLLPESLFLDALCLERKRAERSRKLFVLALLDPLPSPDGADRAPLLKRVVPAIVSSIRETDIAGWHQENAALGVIFLELGMADPQAAVATLRTKVTGILQSALGAQDTAGLRVTFHCFPEEWGNGQAGVPIEKLYPDLVEREASRKLPSAIKRATDVLGCAMGLLLLAPLLGLIALAIKLSSPGPILYRQKRIGQYGVHFDCLKFRSMYTGNDPKIHMDFVKRFIGGELGPCSKANGHAKIYKITEDPRLTSVGRLLRRTSLDELPQLLNVLRGDMSLVGPRPPIPYELEAYDIWHRRRLLEVRPGITGLWQVSGRSQLPFDDMVRLDLRYATSWSLWLDLKILLRTPRAVLSGAGAY